MSWAMFYLSLGRCVEQEFNLHRNDIEACVTRAVYEVSPLTEEKQISVRLSIENAGLGVLFDADKLERVLVNLLENACKFTPRRGTIDITGNAVLWQGRAPLAADAEATIACVDAGDAPNAYRIDVRDSGIGIPNEHLDSIFEEYTSYSGSRDRAGGGLGLAICRSIVNGHRGRIWAEPCASGACLSFVLPATPEEPGRKNWAQSSATNLLSKAASA